MQQCLDEIPGAIGYMDSSFGHDAGLQEIELRNIYGQFLSSKDASVIVAAAANWNLPSSADADFGSVTPLVNTPGEFSWPMVDAIYVYVRKDLSHLGSPAAQSLLVAFLEGIYSGSYIYQCQEETASLGGLVLVPQNVRALALDGLAMLQIDPSAPTWIFEKYTSQGIGQGDYVISSKRRTYAEFKLSTLASTMAVLATENNALNSQVESLQQELTSTKAVTAELQLNVRLILQLLGYIAQP
mmetsp:Transcript_16966/g.28172  ORF Transcript_16966/g.28172 Transcript_16966/m.28172 type:complete len:242 (+) Transcript_16966:449-1174(+)